MEFMFGVIIAFFLLIFVVCPILIGIILKINTDWCRIQRFFEWYYSWWMYYIFRIKDDVILEMLNKKKD